MIPFDPATHHRRSIRMKGHDYAAGGVYFVTICAHRAAGNIFAAPAVKAMVATVWENMPHTPVGASLVEEPEPHAGASAGASLVGAHPHKAGTHKGCPYVVMPDHSHAIVRMCAGARALGDVIGAFKSLVVHGYIAGVKEGRYPPFPGKIWHRNYYERIVRTPEAESRIAEYIRANPWRLVTEGIHEGCAYRMIGNPALMNWSKIGVLCSRNCPPDPLDKALAHAQSATSAHCFIGGFHSKPERAILSALLDSGARLVCCPAWGIGEMRIPSDWLPALEQNRMLVVEMRNTAGNLAAAEARNRFVLGNADKRWIPHASPGGMLARLLAQPPG